MKSEENNSATLDFFSPVLLIVTILTIVVRELLQVESKYDFPVIILSLVAVFVSFLYFYKVRQLPESTSTPFSDTLVTIGGLYLGFVLLLQGIDLQQYSIYGSLLFIGTGVIGRIILLDRVVISLFTGIRSFFSSIISWIASGWTRILRFFLLISGVVLLVAPWLAGEYTLDIVNLLFSLFFFLGVFEREEPNIILRILATIGILILFVIGVNTSSILNQVTIFLLAVSILLWILGYDSFRAGLDWLLDVVPRILRWISTQFRGFITYVKMHPVGSSQVFLLIMALVAYIAMPASTSIASFDARIVVALFLVFLAILPSAINFIRRVGPKIWRSVVSTIRWITSFLGNWNSYPPLFALGGTIALIILPNEPIEVTLGLAVITAFSFALMSDQYVMRFYDRFYSGLHRFIVAILPAITLGSFLSFLSYIMLIIFLFPGLILPSSLIPYRILFLIGAIILWNIAYKHRRDRFVSFINWISGGLLRRFSEFISWLLRNVFLIGLTLLGFVFFFGAFGLIFPGTLGFVDAIFGEVTDDRLVSLIIGIFLLFMGGYTIQQAQARKNTLQRNRGGRN